MSNIQWLLLGIAFSYLILLFWIAYWVENSDKVKNYIKNSSIVYSLSLAIYCTAWTYYGSIGTAAKSGLNFLPIYLGPTLIMPLWYFFLRKMIRVVKMNNISTIADFLSLRYGVSSRLGMVITLLCILGIVPYISLQIKAISNSFELIMFKNAVINSAVSANIPVIISIVLGAFILLFGVQKMESNEHHTGIVASIAFESILKLIAFLIAGIFISYVVFDSPQEIYVKSKNLLPEFNKLITIQGKSPFAEWFGLTVLSAIAVTLLPRQFQVSVIENQNESHLKTSIWLFPLYLLLINLFVLPIALGGNILFNGLGMNPDYYILDIPLKFNQTFISVIVFIGGFSAASAMIILETIALSNMLSNNFLIPIILQIGRNNKNINDKLANKTLTLRRISIVAILLSSLFYYKILSPYYSLVSIGLISFVFIAQFFPSVVGALYWKKSTKKAVYISLFLGVSIWLYTLVFPSIIDNFTFGKNIIEHGLFGCKFLKPTELFYLSDFSPVVHGFFWSMFFNVFSFILVSLATIPSNIEKQQAYIYVDVFKYTSVEDSSVVWKETALISDISSLLEKFLGKDRAQLALNSFSKRYNIEIDPSLPSDPKIIPFVERLLSKIVGPISARIMVESVIKDKEIYINEMLDIIQESKEIITLNRELIKKSNELEKAKFQLENTNNKLIQHDLIKDDFLATVSHELKSPLTSIRSFSEILNQNKDLSEEEISNFSNIINKESTRITRLINQLLDLEKYDSGNQSLQLSAVNMNEFIEDLKNVVLSEMEEKKLKLIIDLNPTIHEILMDKDKIYQVCINLLSNAIKFSKQEDEICVIISKNDINYLFEIVDSGKGIEKEYQELIFEKFYQARNQALKKPVGSGLGLAICKKIIQLHKGEIYVKKSSPLGTSFEFKIPKINLN